MNWRRTFVAALAASAALCLMWMPAENPVKKRRLPAHTIVRGDADENNERDRFEQWYEYMHKAAPGVSWRQMDANTRLSKYRSNSAYRSGNPQIQEVLANGNLVGQWKERGSANQAGRVWVADLDTATGAVYAGSDGGNVWKGNLQGSGWTVLNEKLKFDIKMLRVLPNGNGKRLLTAGGQYVHYSDDDGVTWQVASGLSNVQSWGYIKRGLVLGDSAQTVYLLLYEWDYVNWNAVTSLYKSTDLGTSFARVAVYAQPAYGSIDNFDLWGARYGTYDVDLINNDSIFSMDRVTDALTFKSTITLSATGNTLLTGYHDSAYHYLYAYVNQYIYRSLDSGYTWNMVVNFPYNPFNTSFSCSCNNKDNIYFGDIECHYSTNGGSNWSLVNQWWTYYGSPANQLHADIPNVMSQRDANGNEFLFIGTDGGLYTSYNNLQTVQNISLLGLNASQYYSVFTNRNNLNHIYAGAQDQGFQRSQIDSGTVLGFDQVISGDYGHIVSTDSGSTIWMNYPGFADYYQNASTGTSTATWNFNNTIPFWIPPLMADRQLPSVCYLAGGNLNTTGSKIIELTDNGSTINATERSFNFKAASGGGNISAIASSPINDLYWYVLMDNGKFFRSSDGGFNWTMTSTSGLGAHYLYGATIYPSHTTLGVVYIGGSGYSNPPAYRSTNHGQNFTAITTGLPSTHIFELTGNFNDQLIFAATEVGPYVYVVADNKWYDMEGVGAPDQTYWSVEYIYATNTVRFATYGRGIWDFNIAFPGVGTPELSVQNSISIFPNPAKDQFSIALGSESNGIAEWELFDVSGKKVKDGKVNVSNGSNSIPVSCTDLQSGIYFLQLSAGSKSVSRKVIVSR